MTRRWILQANPDRHDIDAALEELDTINWRIPQHTAEVVPGDIALLWRSGADAGIIGVGRVVGPPARRVLPPAELRFNLEEERELEVATRAPIKVTKISLIPRAEVEKIPEMTGHQILVAPRQTVYPIDEAQWSSLKDLVTATPPEFEDEALEEAAGFPHPFAWRDRRRGVYPLPGGHDAYLESLRGIAERVTATQPERDDLEGWLRNSYGLSETSARFTVDFLERIGLLQGGAGRYNVSSEMKKWMAAGDNASLIALFHARVQFVGEMLHELREPMAAEQLRRLAKSKYGLEWSSRAQIDRRRGWLQSAGLIETDDEGRLSLTEAGHALESQLDLHEPEPAQPEPPAQTPQQPPPEQTAGLQEPAQAASIIQGLHASAHDTSDTTALEKAVARAFGFLGFDSTWLGGAGKTDVLLVADLGPDERYRVVVDCKTTSHEAVPDHQIDWITLRDHRVQHEADLAALVAPAFRGDRLAKRAGENEVALITVDDLAGICEQHAMAPLGLDIYRGLFAQRDPEVGVQSIAESSEEAVRKLDLASHIVKQLRQLERDELPLGAKDLYWNLKNEFAQEDVETPPTVDEIQEVLDALASPAIGLLRRAGGGFRTLGSLDSMARRLLVLAQRISPASDADSVG